MGYRKSIEISLVVGYSRQKKETDLLGALKESGAWGKSMQHFAWGILNYTYIYFTYMKYLYRNHIYREIYIYNISVACYTFYILYIKLHV